MNRLKQLLVRYHPFGTLTVLLGLLLNGLDFLELIHLDRFGDLSWLFRMGPLILGASVVFGAFFFQGDDA